MDNPELNLKRPPTRREPSARLKENVTIDKVDPAHDVLLVAAVRLGELDGRCYPVIIDIALFPMIECIRARDQRLIAAGGKWIGGVPKVISKRGKKKSSSGLPLNDSDYEKDTNFGKLKRIPYKPLQIFMRKYRMI